MATQLLSLKSGRMYDIMFMYDHERIMKSLGYLRAIQKNNKVAHLFFKPDSETAPISFDDSKRINWRNSSRGRLVSWKIRRAFTIQ